jgi:hypothetical protein
MVSDTTDIEKNAWHKWHYWHYEPESAKVPKVPKQIFRKKLNAVYK